MTMWMLVLITSFGETKVESYATRKACIEEGKRSEVNYECRKVKRPKGEQ